MTTSLVAFLLATAVAAVVTPLVRNLARARGLFDHADGIRKMHDAATPRLGGIGIIVAFYAALFALPLLHSSKMGAWLLADGQRLWSLAGGGLAIGLLGVYDDLRGTDARTKFTVQFLVAGSLYFFGFRIETVAVPFASAAHIGSLSAPLTILWIVGVTNAFNLIDGLDGLAGGIALIALVAIFAIGALRAEPLMMFFAASLAGAVVGFLFYNFNPATIFMGDSGSLFLGFMLATSSVRASQKASTAVVLLVPLVLLAIPIADTLLAVTRRAVRRQRLFAGDREHVHHRLIALGLSHRQAVIGLYSACSIFAASALFLYVSHNRYLKGSLILVLVSASAAAIHRLWRHDRHLWQVRDELPSGVVPITSSSRAENGRMAPELELPDTPSAPQHAQATRR